MVSIQALLVINLSFLHPNQETNGGMTLLMVTHGRSSVCFTVVFVTDPFPVELMLTRG